MQTGTAELVFSESDEGITASVWRFEQIGIVQFALGAAFFHRRSVAFEERDARMLKALMEPLAFYWEMGELERIRQRISERRIAVLSILESINPPELRATPGT